MKNWYWHVIRFTTYVFFPIGMFWYASDPSHFEKTLIKHNLKWAPPVDYDAIDKLERIRKRRQEERLVNMQEEYEKRHKVQPGQVS